MFKRLTMKTGVTKLRKLGALAAMVTNLMLPEDVHRVSMEEKKTVDSIIRELLHVQNNIENEVRMSGGNNSIREEFYLSSSFSSRQRDWVFPSLQILDFILVSRQNSYFKAYASFTKEVMNCLKTTVLEHSQSNFDSLPASAKRMIILCAELAVMMTELQPFRAKYMERILRIIRDPRRTRRTALANQPSQDSTQDEQKQEEDEESTGHSELGSVEGTSQNQRRRPREGGPNTNTRRVRSRTTTRASRRIASRIGKKTRVPVFLDSETEEEFIKECKFTIY
jgi:hypothetical protein